MRSLTQIMAGLLLTVGCSRDVTAPNLCEVEFFTQKYQELDPMHEPQAELELEGTYQVEILGEPDRMSNEDLRRLEEPFSKANPTYLSTLDAFVIADPICRENSVDGVYYWTPSGKDEVWVKSTEGTVAGHEIGHHTHVEMKQTCPEFDERWSAIPTTIPIEGEWVEVTTGQAIELVDRLGLHWFAAENGPTLKGFGGFIRAYGLGKEHSGIDEDVATMFEPILSFSSYSNFRNPGGLAYWDPEFTLDPYLEKLDLIEECEGATKEAIDATRAYFTDRYDTHTRSRDVGYVSSRLGLIAQGPESLEETRFDPQPEFRSVDMSYRLDGNSVVHINLRTYSLDIVDVDVWVDDKSHRQVGIVHSRFAYDLATGEIEQYVPREAYVSQTGANLRIALTDSLASGAWEARFREVRDMFNKQETN